jgi:zinc protease
MLGAKQSPADFEKALWVILNNMGKQAVSEKQLQIAKKNMIANEVFAQDSLYLRAKEIGRMETVGIGAIHKDEWLNAIRAVTAKDVQEVVAKYLRPERATTGILKPEVHS